MMRLPVVRSVAGVHDAEAEMAMAAILFPAGGTVPLDTGRTARLARLGVTSVALLGDDGSTCLIVDGWSFDVARSSAELVRAFAGMGGIRILRPHVQMALIPNTQGDSR